MRALPAVGGVVVTLAWLIAGQGVGVAQVGAAEVAADYEQVIAGRADKVLATLDGLSPEARGRVRETLLDFSRSINAWHDAHGARRQELKSSPGDEAKGDLATLEETLGAIRTAFVERLSADLTPEQVEKVKDGLTYNVLHVTERAYRDMIERLTDEQKTMIHDRLVEARDLAIGEGSSGAKHAVFGKFKGRINNELSRQGYDLKQEERGWQARRKAAAEAAGTTETK
jgi:hypothetical protein